MASTAITGPDATDSADAIGGPDRIAGLDAIDDPDVPRPGPGTAIPSAFAGRRSWPSDAVLSGSPVGAAGDESSCSVLQREVPTTSAVWAHYGAGEVRGQPGTPQTPSGSTEGNRTRPLMYE